MNLLFVVILGQVFVGLKCSAFEPSSPFRHMTELHQLIASNNSAASKPIVFIYSDGGPDHRITFISVKLSLICLFLQLDLDYLCACRTAPYNSWRNPVERIMSVINLGLQCVGLARAKMPQLFEEEVAKCNTLKEIRRIAFRVEGFDTAVQDSLSPVKALLTDILCRLQFNDSFIQAFSASSASEISNFWSALLAIDSTLKEDIQYTKKKFSGCTDALQFIKHCCQSSHYAFDILKCGESSCTICRPVRLPADVFRKLNHLPHPTPGEDNHYAPFSDVFGTNTSEEHRPSYSVKQSKKNTLPFYASVQHVKNIEMMVECEECGLWRLLYSKRKVKKEARLRLQRIIEDHTYTCGAKLSNLDLSDEFKDIEIRTHLCGDPIERLYYSANFTPICVYCGKDQPFTEHDIYPQCEDCSEKPAIHK